MKRRLNRVLMDRPFRAHALSVPIPGALPRAGMDQAFGLPERGNLRPCGDLHAWNLSSAPMARPVANGAVALLEKNDDAGNYLKQAMLAYLDLDALSEDSHILLTFDPDR